MTHFFLLSTVDSARWKACRTQDNNSERSALGSISKFFSGSCCSRCGFFPALISSREQLKKLWRFSCAAAVVVFTFPQFSVHRVFISTCKHHREREPAVSQSLNTKKFWWVFVEQNNFRSALSKFSAPSTCVPKTPQELNWQNTIKKLIFYFYFALLHWASQNTSRSRRNQQYYLIILLFSLMQELSKWEWIWKTLQYLQTKKKTNPKKIVHIKKFWLLPNTSGEVWGGEKMLLSTEMHFYLTLAYVRTLNCCMQTLSVEREAEFIGAAQNL